MNNTKGKLKEYRGELLCFLAAVLIAFIALNVGRYVEPGKILPTALSMRTDKLNENILGGINDALDDISLIRSGSAGQNSWRLLTFIHLDVFFYIALLIPQAARAILMAGYYARFGLCCSAMYYFMAKHIKVSKFAASLFAVMFAFSSQIILNAQFSAIMNMAVLLPMLLSSVDSYYKTRSWKSFSFIWITAFGVGASGGYGLLIGIPAAVFISLLMAIGLYEDSKMVFRSWCKVLTGFISGLVMTAAFAIPGLMVMKTDIDLAESVKNAKVSYTVIDFFRAMFMLRSGSITMNSISAFYIGIFTLAALVAFVINEEIPLRLKVASAVMTAVFYIVCSSTFVNETISIFGASPLLTASRLICLEILLFFMAGIGLKNIKGLGRGGFIAVCLIPLAFLIVSNNSTAGTSLSSVYLISTFIAIVLDALLVYGIAKDRLSGRAKAAVLVLGFVFVGINAAFVMFNNTITKTSTEEYFLPEYGDEEAQTLIYDDEFELAALNGGDKYLVIPEDISVYERGSYPIDDVNFLSEMISGNNLFDEIYITPSIEADVHQKEPDRFILDPGSNYLPFSPFTITSNERIFIYCTAMCGAKVSIESADGDSARIFTGPFLTELDNRSGEIKLDFEIESDGEEVCYIALFKLDAEAYKAFMSYSGDAASSRFKIDSRGETRKCTLILPYAYDDTKVKVNGSYRNTFEYAGKLCAAFDGNGGEPLEVTVEQKSTGILPGAALSVLAAACLVAIPISQRYNEKKRRCGEGNNNNA
ncbi:MAG: YfhO family protein [Clostridiales bacterium]|nr:YfhO family protein [Clostridiales bacterium]